MQAPLPEVGPQEWQNLSPEISNHSVVKVVQWYEMGKAFPNAVRFVCPNKARSTKDAAANAWQRAEDHFVLKYSVTIQTGLQGEVGRASKQRKKSGRGTAV